MDFLHNQLKEILKKIFFFLLYFFFSSTFFFPDTEKQD